MNKKTKEMSRRLLFSFAHPGDESFFAGGTASKYASLGWEVVLTSATKGERAYRTDYENLSKVKFGLLSEKGLQEAAGVLGISEIIMFSYRYGMLQNEHYGEIEDKLHREMCSVRPKIVITFDPTGINNHPDHKKICMATTYAFQKYAKDCIEAQSALDIGEEGYKNLRLFPYDPKLYYICFPESLVRYFQRILALPREAYGNPLRGTPDDMVTTVIDIGRHAKNKVKASISYGAQDGDWAEYFKDTRNPLLKQEFFLLRMHGTHEVFMGKNDRVLSRL